MPQPFACSASQVTIKSLVKTALRILLVLFAASVGVPTATAQSAEIQGVQILEQAISAGGGRQSWQGLNDFRASGTLSLYSNDKVMDAGRATVLGAGLKRFRLTAQLQNETRMWAWKDGVGILSTTSGLGGPIGRHNLAVLEGMTLPIQRVVALLDGPSRSVQLVESVPVDGRQVYRVRLIRNTSDSKDALALGRVSLVTDILIDQQTFVIVAIEDTIHPNNHARDTFTHRVTYGDYHTLVGVQIPFSIKEEVAGQLTWALQLESFAPNVGLTSSEFALD